MPSKYFVYYFTFISLENLINNYDLTFPEITLINEYVILKTFIRIRKRLPPTVICSGNMFSTDGYPRFVSWYT